MKIRKGGLSYILLTLLEGAVDGTVLLSDFAGNPGNYSILGRDYPLKRSALSKAIARLKKRGLITREREDDDKVILKLTNEGKTAMFLMVEDDKQWDGKWRVVVWDIPEQKRIIRNLFRRNLKKWGFKNLQKSVWVSKKDVYEKLTAYVKDLGIEKWVWIFESDKYSPMGIN